MARLAAGSKRTPVSMSAPASRVVRPIAAEAHLEALTYYWLLVARLK